MSNRSQAKSPTRASSAEHRSSSPPAAGSTSASTPKANGRASETSGTLKRKRLTSSRGVASLTPEQLERKRANDREAQRAIRERTKNHIERLNAEIKELKSQRPYHDLQAALRQRDAALAENEELRLRIKAFFNNVRPLMGGVLSDAGHHQPTGAAAGGTSLDDLAAAATNTNPRPVADMTSPNLSTHAASPVSSHSTGHPGPYRYRAGPPALRSWTPSDPTIDQSPREPSSHTEFAGHGVYNHSDERLGLGYLLHGNQQQASRSQNGALPTPDIIPQGVYASWSTLPRNTEPSCPLDGLLLNFLDEQRRLADTGVPLSELVGPAYPNFNAVLFSNTAHTSHPLSKVMSDILRTLPDVSTLPEQVGIMYIMFLVLRWSLEPTRANYEQLPDWMTPRPSQLFNPHPAWMDYLIFPLLRDATIHTRPHIPFSEFFVPFTTTVSLNWPYQPSTVLISARDQRPPPANTSLAPLGADEPAYMINPAFVAHLRRLENWTLGPAFAEEFPQWRGCVNIKERDGSVG